MLWVCCMRFGVTTGPAAWMPQEGRDSGCEAGGVLIFVNERCAALCAVWCVVHMVGAKTIHVMFQALSEGRSQAGLTLTEAGLSRGRLATPAVSGLHTHSRNGGSCLDAESGGSESPVTVTSECVCAERHTRVLERLRSLPTKALNGRMRQITSSHGPPP